MKRLVTTMLLTKTRTVAASKEKQSKKEKKYTAPRCYSSQKKSADNVSTFYKKEDAV